MIPILMDGRFLERQQTGIGRYLAELLRDIKRTMPVHGIRVLERDGNHAIAGELGLASIRLPHYLRWIKEGVWVSFIAPLYIKKLQPRLFWSTSVPLPRTRFGSATLLTLYDLVWKLYPRSMSSLQMLSYRAFFASDVKNADFILSISQGSSLFSVELDLREAEFASSQIKHCDQIS